MAALQVARTGPGSCAFLVSEQGRPGPPFVFEELGDRLDDGFFGLGVRVCFPGVLFEQLAGLLVRQAHELDELFIVDEGVGFFVNAPENREQHLFRNLFLVGHQESQYAA